MQQLNKIELKSCPYSNLDTCAICPRLYFFLDGQLTFERQCARYPDVKAQKQEIKEKYSEFKVEFLEGSRIEN